MAKEDVITITSPTKGMAKSAFSGTQEIRGLNTTEKEGAVYPNLKLVKNSGATITDTPIAGIQDSSYNWYIADDDGDLWTDNSGWSEITGRTSSLFSGMNIWNNYLFILRTNTIDLYDIGGAEGWTNDWTNTWDTIGGIADDGMDSVISENVLYWCADNNIESITAIGTFDPDNSATYTIATDNGGTPALDLPADYEGRQIIEYNVNDIWVGANNKIIGDSKIFKWDKVSKSYSMINFGSRYIWLMIQAGNLVYVFAGNDGDIYVTNGTSVQWVNRLPIEVLDVDTTSGTIDVRYSPTAKALIGDKIYFATLKEGNSQSHGVFSLDTITNELEVAHITSSGAINANCKLLKVDNSASVRPYLLVGWTHTVDLTTTRGIDISSPTVRYTGDLAFFITRMYRVGTKLAPKTFNSIEFELTKPQATGDSVKMYYRKASNGSWLSVFNNAVEDAAGDTLLWDTNGEQSKHIDFGASGVENIQFKIVLNDEAELLEVRVK